MLEVYNILWRGSKAGLLYYDTEKDRFSAKLLIEGKDYPHRLFGFNGKKEINDKEFRDYLDGTVMPINRQNVSDVLEKIGLTYYDKWEIYKAYLGRNPKDYCEIERIE